MTTRDNTVEFFPHDKDMRHDPKVNALRIKFPGWGYTVWNMLLEIFSDSRSRCVEWDELNQELLAADFLIEKTLLIDIVNYAVTINLLQIKDGKLMSIRFQERFGALDEKREQKSTAGKLGAVARWGENRSEMAQNGEMMAPPKQTIASKRKEEKRREEKSKESSSCCSSSCESVPTISAEEEKQQQSFVLYFFLKNWKEPKKEFFEKFLPWNNSGGRRWSQMDSNQRQAALLQWTQKPPQLPRFTGVFLQMWEQVVYKTMEIAPPEIIWAVLDDRLRWEKSSANVYRLHCSQKLYDFIEQYMDHYKPIIFQHYGKINLQYFFTDDVDTQRQRTDCVEVPAEKDL